jgi:hypothetical protein
MRESFVMLTLTVLLSVAGTFPVVAQAEERSTDSDDEVTQEFESNLLAAFSGIVIEGRHERASALGVEYERRLSSQFGVGVLVEHTFGELDFWVYAVPFAYHTGRWKLYVAPGIEESNHHSESLVRFGGEYAYEIGSWEISPQIDLDFVSGHQVLVSGVTFGKQF